MNQSAHNAWDSNTPVLVGVGLIDQREEDANLAAEPMQLMIQAALAAGNDCGVPELLEQIERILVPIGRWRYGNPGAMIGDALGSASAATVNALPGVSQQSILSDAASAIAAGEITTALVVGGEAGYRLSRARIQGIEVSDTENHQQADVVLQPNDSVLPTYERERGLGVMPVGYYALIESAYRHEAGIDVDTRRDTLARRYHRYSQIAAENPYAWDEQVVSPDTIRDERMLAFPYAKHHVSNWSVDQASALLFTSAGEAERLGIDRPKWVFPQAFTESNHMVDVTARGRLGRSIGAELAGLAVLEAAGCGPEDLDHIELYTCFPIALDTYAEGLGLSDDADWSFTGAMPFAGGPFNNFVLHATAQLAERLRQDGRGRGLVTTVSGVLTKQGFAIWGTDPNANGYQFVDVTDETAAASDERAVDPSYRGPASIAAYTVMHDREGPQCGVVVVDLPDGRRSIASSADPAVMAAMEQYEFCGLTVDVDAADFELMPASMP